jgi:hypothetical protein
MLCMQACRGAAPVYGPEQRAQLRKVLFAARHLLAEATDALWDSRSGEDLLPLLLQARARPSRGDPSADAAVPVSCACMRQQ